MEPHWPGCGLLDYHVLDVIGEGSFGRVYKGRRKFSGQVVALKFIPKVGRSDKELCSLQREIEIMRDLRHPNIIQMLDSFETDKEVVVVTEYAEGELFQVLEDDGNLSEEQVREIAGQLVSALYYLHSHRVLHRDLKPQNVLIGKGGVLKLCDFGFARAMSLQTVVLTSIKGTPLYMCPELVEERPYDHTADLWSLGCILYELYVGMPPFYTSSIFQLVSLIVRDPVKWPKGISPHFKEFLQGLLTKDPRQRLSWPALLLHPFVADRVIVLEEQRHWDCEKPLTCLPTAEEQTLKEEQSRALGPRAHHSRILRKARQRMLEEARRTEMDTVQPQAALEPEPRQEPPAPARERMQVMGEEPATKGPLAGSAQPMDRTSTQQGLCRQHSLHHISQDYELEFPDIQVGTRKVKKKSHSTDNEDEDSDGEWEQLIEATDRACLHLSTPLTILRDRSFQQRLQARLGDASTQVLDGMLEGASRLRQVLRVVTNLLATRCDGELLRSFCRNLQLPQLLLQLTAQMVHSPHLQQAWRAPVLCDLVSVLSAYFAGDFTEDSGGGTQDLEQSAAHFLTLCPQLLSQGKEQEPMLREKTLTCLLLLCETIDRSSSATSQLFYESLLSENSAVLLNVLQGCQALKQATTGQEAPPGAAAFEEGVRAAYRAALASLCHLPPRASCCQQAKSKVAQFVNGHLFPTETPQGTDRFLRGIKEQSLALDTLKVLYSCSNVSKDTCRLIMDEALENLLQILEDEIFPCDPVLTQTQELSLYLLSLTVIQLDHVPERLERSVGIITSILLRSPAQTNAAALLLMELSSRGCGVELHLEDFLQTAHITLTSAFQLAVTPPVGLGQLDGLLTLLLQFGSEGNASVLLDSEVWTSVWQRVSRALCLHLDHTVMEGETPRPGRSTPTPDWSSLSPCGVLVFLSLATQVFTAAPYQCVSLLSSSTSVVLATLGYLVSEPFLTHLEHRLSCGPVEHSMDCVSCVVLRVSQLLCFPFAMDVEEPLFSDILLALLEGEIVRHLVQVSLSDGLVLDPELPLALLCRLSLTAPPFLAQMVCYCSSQQAASGLVRLLDVPDPSALCQLLSLLALASRAPDQPRDFLEQVLGEPGLLLRAVRHREAGVRAKACALASALLARNVLGAEGPLLEAVMERLRDGEPGVRAAACIAIGNAAYGSESAPDPVLGPALPLLVGLLGDGRPGTQRDAAWGLANLCRYRWAQGGRALVRARAPHRLLQLACQDGRPDVTLAALAALRSLSCWTYAREVLVSLKASERLSWLLQRTQRKASLSAPNAQTRHSVRTILHQCAHLAQSLH